jgi:hypothetical protein
MRRDLRGDHPLGERGGCPDACRKRDEYHQGEVLRSDREEHDRNVEQCACLQYLRELVMLGLSNLNYCDWK